MKKYMWWSLVFLAISCFVTIHHEQNAHDPNPVNGEWQSYSITPPYAPQADVNKEQPNRDSPSWNLAFLVFGWPGGVTVWALFITMVAIAEQSHFTRVAAKATMESVKLQEVAYEQWLNIDRWNAFAKRNDNGEPVLLVEFTVTNPSPFPLTMTEAVYSVIGIELATATMFCPPKEPFSISEVFPLTEPQLSAYLQGNLEVRFNAKFSYVGIRKTSHVQEVSGVLECGRNGVTNFHPG